MTISLVRHILMLLSWYYVYAAGHAMSEAKEPYTLEWLAKVAGVIIVSLVIGIGPDIFSFLTKGFGPLPKFQLPSLPNLSQLHLPKSFAVPDAVSPGAVPAGNKTTDPSAKMTAAVKRTQLLVELMQAAGDNEELAEQIRVLNDGLFRQDFTKKG